MYNTALFIVRHLREAGFESYLAGGCVRDNLMNLEPKDYDIVTDATPEAIERIFPNHITVGKAFGVVIVIVNNYQFEVTTFRQDGKYSDSRRPDSVTFSDWKNDVLRRDFTINGMLFDPLNNKLLDIVGGEQDIKMKIIKTIGDPLRRFSEDKLRMMRAVRFACELNFNIEDKTEKAIKELASEITQVSFERIRDELKIILMSKNRARGIALLFQFGLLREILPEVVAMDKIPQPPQFHSEGDVFTHTKLCLEYLENPSFELALATLLHDIGKPHCFKITDRIRFNGHEKVGEIISEKICRRLKLSLSEIDKVVYLVSNHMLLKDVRKMRQATLKRLIANRYFGDLLKLFRVDKLASDKDLTDLEFLEAKVKEFKKEELKPKPLIIGKDLIKLGLVPGPIFSEILRKVEDAQLEGEIKTKNEAIEFVKKTFANFWKI